MSWCVVGVVLLEEERMLGFGWEVRGLYGVPFHSLHEHFLRRVVYIHVIVVARFSRWV